MMCDKPDKYKFSSKLLDNVCYYKYNNYDSRPYLISIYYTPINSVYMYVTTKVWK